MIAVGAMAVVLGESSITVLSTCRPFSGATSNSVGDKNDKYSDSSVIMVATERELADDAQWKRIQQNTFTRWANEHLKCVDRRINNLETDLSDGLHLIALIEVLAKQSLPKHNKKPLFRLQKLENVSVALKFLQDVEFIRIVNIDSSHIVDCKLKLILGLIWTLILHYSISLPIWEGEEEIQQNGSPLSTPKQRLMKWIQTRLPQLSIQNFTTDWNSGKAVGALVDAIVPGLCPDWEDWDVKDALTNASEAMSLARDWLEVPQLIQPTEIVNPNVDEQSMMTYLSQFPNAKLKDGAPIRAKRDPRRVRVYGPGIDGSHITVGCSTNFNVDTTLSGHGDVQVSIQNPHGQLEPVSIESSNEITGMHTVLYKPQIEGRHVIHVNFDGKELPQSPFSARVQEANIDISTVVASGPGLLNGVLANKATHFDIQHSGGKRTPEVVILDPNGNKSTVPAKLRATSQNHWNCDYTPVMAGLHSINVFFSGQHVPNSPFGVMVSSAYDPKRVKVTGRGVQPRGIRVGDDANIYVHTEGAWEENPCVQITNPDGNTHKNVQCTEVRENVYGTSFSPLKEGTHLISVSFGGQEIMKSPFHVHVGPKKSSKIRAYGPGLSRGIVNQPALFTVETNGETGDLGFSVEGPSQATIECNDNGDGSADIIYYPVIAGEYAVHILCDNEDIPGSPFMSSILSKTNFTPGLVKVYGLGVDETSLLELGSVATFTVDARDAGTADVGIHVTNEYGDMCPVHVKEISNGLFDADYLVKSKGRYSIQVTYGDVAVKGSPFRMAVKLVPDASLVKCYGSGIQEMQKVNREAQFTVDTSATQKAELEVNILSEKNQTSLQAEILNISDDKFLVSYTPQEPGEHVIVVTYDSQHVESSPFRIKVDPSIDVNSLRLKDFTTDVFTNSPTEFRIKLETDVNECKPSLEDEKLSVKIASKSDTPVDTILTALSDSEYSVVYTVHEEGDHIVNITYEGQSILNSPLVIKACHGYDASRCIASGPGLSNPLLNEINKFIVVTRGAGVGGLSLTIEGPSQAKMNFLDNCDGSCAVEYIPTEPGLYDIIVKYNDEHIPDSPFLVLVPYSTNAKDVRAYGLGLESCRNSAENFFSIDASRVVPAPIVVNISYDEVSYPAVVHDNSDRSYDVSYTVPPECSSMIKLNIMYDGEDIAGSPFDVGVICDSDLLGVSVYGDALTKPNVPASLPVKLTVNGQNASNGRLSVDVFGPDDKLRRVTTERRTNSNNFDVIFVPDDCGTYKLFIRYDDVLLTGGPFVVSAVSIGAADKCKILDWLCSNVCYIGDLHRIKISKENAGEGAITCCVRSGNSSYFDADILEKDDIVTVEYTCPKLGHYTTLLKFGGQTIPDGLHSFAVTEQQPSILPSSAQKFSQQFKQQEQQSLCESKVNKSVANGFNNSTYSQQSVKQFRAARLENIPLPKTEGHVTAEVKMPSGNVDKPTIEDNRDGTVSVKYDPREEGLHELAVKFNGEHVQGSPYKIHVDSISSGYVTAYGSGLSHGVSGEPSNFTISTKGAGAGGLSMSVEGPSKADISCHDNKDGTVSVSYLPTAPGEYKLSVRFADKHIKGSPFNVKITGEGRKRNQISVGSCSEVSLPGKISDADIRSLNASIQAPSGLEEPCFLKRLPTGNIGISFTPREIGEHVVSVKKLGSHITNSPFKINVCEREVGDARKVKVSGAALKEGKTHTLNTFNVDTRNAGFGGLSLSIEGPSKAEIQCNDNKDGTLDISYKPTEPGYYIINLKFADHHVQASPFTVKVTGEGTNRQREKIQRQRDAVPITEVGSKCKLTFKMPGITSFDLSATVTSPGGVTEDAEINEIKDGLYAVHFIPKELGVHSVSVKYKDIHIPGSPFQFTVGPYKDHGAHLVKAGGAGLERGEQGEWSEFNVWTREAGSGQLAISVEGPSKAEINFTDRKDGSCDVSYRVTEPGEYRIGLKFNDQHVPESPFKVYISPAVGDAHLLEVAQFPEGIIQADKPSQFIVRRNGAKGNLDAKIVGPSGIEDDCFVQIIDIEEYSIRFMPRENGIHKIHAKFNGVHIPGSPFSVKVGKDTADPAAVHVHGNGLNDIKTGIKTDFIIDTLNAGAGTLAVNIDGPCKVSMDCTEVEEGYKVRYTPLAPGDYYISIKYNNNHIVGSPFRVTSKGDAKVADIGGQESSSVVVETVAKTGKGATNRGPILPHFKSDASKVSSKGMGLKKAYLGKQNQFTVNAQDGGTNILFVGIHGPKGPCEEVFIKHNGRHQYNISYVVRDRGDYIVIVKWGDDHIPGSPFKVDV